MFRTFASAASALVARIVFLALASAATGIVAVSAAPHRRAATPASPASTAHLGISALDLLELQIGFTTLLATYYEPVAPARLVGGARTGVAAYLAGRGLGAANLPYAPARLDRGAAGDAIDRLVLDVLLRYQSGVVADDVVQAALAGEAASLRDPYTLLFRPTAFHAFNAYLNGNAFGGIGAVVVLAASGGVRIEQTIAASPAERAGVRGGDMLVAIDGRPTAGESADAVRAQLRGAIGTRVRLALVRDGSPQPEVTLVRAKIVPPVVTARVLPDGVGYVDLSRFGDDAAAQLGASLREFASHQVPAMVLDLRGNGGGYGDEAKKVASDFIASGPIFSTRERRGAIVTENASGSPLFTGKLAVLVDGDSASAAEIVAGALQDNGRATLVGTKTFGKGVVQSVFPLPDGAALKVTTARYLTPKGRNIDGTGLVPDVVVTEPPGAERGNPANDPQLALALARLR